MTALVRDISGTGDCGRSWGTCPGNRAAWPALGKHPDDVRVMWQIGPWFPHTPPCASVGLYSGKKIGRRYRFPEEPRAQMSLARWGVPARARLFPLSALTVPIGRMSEALLQEGNEHFDFGRHDS